MNAVLQALTRHKKLLLVAGGSFVLGILLAYGATVWFQNQSPKARPLRESNIPTARSEYKFIDPLIGIRGVDSSTKYRQMQQQVASYIASEQSKGLLIASVDFRDINEPGGFVLNPDEQYTPASLNKVPVMMAYFKIAETDPRVLSDEITYVGTKNHNDVEEIKSAVQLTPGAIYTVDQLIEHMIRYSDNNAADLLTQHLSDIHRGDAFVSVFSDLGIDPNVLAHYTDNVTVQQYSIFLRALYNATYLTRSDSERALQLLSETDFTAGLESGVPNNVLISEKFGEVRMTDSNGTLLGKEIHNCGIVYYPLHPYLLCIMTKAQGDDVKTLEEEISTISRIVYTNMQRMYP